MYVSKKISDFFREVKQDYKIQKTYSSKYDEFGREVNGTKGPKGSQGRNPLRRGFAATRVDAKGNENSQKQGTSPGSGGPLDWLQPTGIGIGTYLSDSGSDPRSVSPVVTPTPHPKP